MKNLQAKKNNIPDNTVVVNLIFKEDTIVMMEARKLKKIKIIMVMANQKAKKMDWILTHWKMHMKIIWNKLKNCLQHQNKRQDKYSTKSNLLMILTVNLMKKWKTVHMKTFVSSWMKDLSVRDQNLKQNMKIFTSLRLNSTRKRERKKNYKEVHHSKNQTNR